MINSFNANIAIEYDVDIAIFLQHLSQWTLNNLSHNRHIHDGHIWTYNTHESLQKFYFPYWSKKQIERLIIKVIDAGLVIKGNYNKSKYDRTCWYALTERGRRYFPELPQHEISITQSETDLPISGNEDPQIGRPIPTNKPTNKKDINKKTLISKKTADHETLEILLANNVHEIPEQMLEDWIVVRKSKKAPVTMTTWNRINNTLCQIKDKLKISPKEAFETMVANAWQSLQLKYFENSQGRLNEKDPLNIVWS